MQVFRLGIDVEQAGDDLADGGVPLQEVHGVEAVVRIIIGGDLLEHEFRAVMLLDDLDRARFVGDRDRRAAGDEIEPVHRLVVLAHIVEALGRPRVIVEGDAGRDHVDEGRALVLDRGPDQRHQLLLVAGKRARHERRAELQRHRHDIDRVVGVDDAALALGATVGGGRKLSFGEPVHAVVLDDVDHVDAAAHRMRELAEPD